LLPVQVNDTTPFTRPPRPLSACRLAIVTTAGLHRRDDCPFGPTDQTYRVIPSNTPTADIVQSHTSLGFDRVPTMRNVNKRRPGPHHPHLTLLLAHRGCASTP
jgi:D-proline reductase (dithiol) PrdB